MLVAIAGAHGKIALRLSSRLAESDHQVIGLIRNPDHAGEVTATGAEAIVCDLEHAAMEEIAAAVRSADVVVFAAGAGPGSGTQRKLTMDRDGAVKLLRASDQTRARYVMVSAVGAEDPPDGDDAFSVYLRAKAEADAAVMASEREWTIVRPGGLTDDRGTGQVRIDTAAFRGQIPRDDVAAVLEALIDSDAASGRVLYVNGGDDPVEQALANALAA